MRQREIDKINRESEKLWRSKFEYIPAKVGTVPMSIWIYHADAQKMMDGTLQPGDKIVFSEAENGSKCTGVVLKLEPILFIDRF